MLLFFVANTNATNNDFLGAREVVAAKTRGRLGNTATRTQIADIAAELKSRNYKLPSTPHIEYLPTMKI